MSEARTPEQEQTVEKEQSKNNNNNMDGDKPQPEAAATVLATANTNIMTNDNDDSGGGNSNVNMTDQQQQPPPLSEQQAATTTPSSTTNTNDNKVSSPLRLGGDQEHHSSTSPPHHHSPNHHSPHHHNHHPPLSPTGHRNHHHHHNFLMNRPLTTHTNLGSPLPSTQQQQQQQRTRSQSLGNAPVGWNLPHHTIPGAPPNLVTAPYSARSVPVSPVTTFQQQAHQFQLQHPGDHLIPLPFTGTGGGNNNGVFPSLPPEPSDIQKAMENAAAKERTRSKKLEEEEMNMTAEQLRDVLKRERHRTGKIAADFAALKASNVKSQFEAEVIEEQRINCLMRRMDTLQQEKGRIIVELEQEEEMLTNTLQKKLDEVKEEKKLLEDEIKREKQSHILLQAQLSDLRNQHLSVAEALEEEDEMEEEG